MFPGDGEAAAPSGHPVDTILQLVMEQLQPLLDGFNRSLDHLSQQVAELATKTEHMKSQQQTLELQAVDQDKEDLQARLEHLLEQVVEVRWQMAEQSTQVENGLHSQHVMLHNNLTSFKTDVDLKLKHHQKMLQVKDLRFYMSELMVVKADRRL